MLSLVAVCPRYRHTSTIDKLMVCSIERIAISSRLVSNIDYCYLIDLCVRRIRRATPEFQSYLGYQLRAIVDKSSVTGICELIVIMVANVYKLSY